MTDDEMMAEDMADDISRSGHINWGDYYITDNHQKFRIVQLIINIFDEQWTYEVDESLRLASEIEIVRDRQDIITTELDDLTAEKASVDEKKQIAGDLLDRAIELEQALIVAIRIDNPAWEPDDLGGHVTMSKNVISRRRKSDRRKSARRKSDRRKSARGRRKSARRKSARRKSRIISN